MKITRRIALPEDGEFYELEEECTLRDAPRVIATIEHDILDVILGGKPHTEQQAKEMAENIVEESITEIPKETAVDMSLIQFSDDKTSATMKKFVDKEIWETLNETMKKRGFKWITAGKNSRWQA